MDKIKFGIIGVGHLGHFHLKVARDIPYFDIIGIYDKDPTRMEDVSKKYDVTVFKDIDELLEKCEAVSIVVPTKSHYEIGVKALDKGCHVFIEKPITETVEQGKRLVLLANEKGLKLQVGHIERFNPAFLSLQHLELSPMFIEAHRLSEFNPRGTDVSVILDIMIHDLDIVLKLVDSPINFLHACGVGVVSPSEDIANVRIEFENGAVANLTASRISAKHMRKMRLFQKDQYISIDFLNKKSEILSLKKVDRLGDKGYEVLPLGEIGEGKNKRDIFFVSPPQMDVNSLKLELEEFARSIVFDKTVKVTGEEGLRALELAHEIIKLMKKPADI
ncbi:Gfo/Idh/MocA family protein [Desulfothermus sp.]